MFQDCVFKRKKRVYFWCFDKIKNPLLKFSLRIFKSTLYHINFLVYFLNKIGTAFFSNISSNVPGPPQLALTVLKI